MPRACKECGKGVGGLRVDKAFCTSSCRNAFNHRRAKRGAEIYDMFMTMRYERTVATKARALWYIACKMANHWREEDVVKREGRLSWRDPTRMISRKRYLRKY